MFHPLLTEASRERLHNWWQALQEEPRRRGERAILKRAQTPDEILLSSAFAGFLQQMPQSWREPRWLSDLAMVAGLLARVRHSDKAFATALGSPKKDSGKAAMSELRFQQLQKSRDADEFFRRMIRAIALLDHKVEPISVAESTLLWLKERRFGVDREPSKRLAVRWATDYYTAFKE